MHRCPGRPSLAVPPGKNPYFARMVPVQRLRRAIYGARAVSIPHQLPSHKPSKIEHFLTILDVTDSGLLDRFERAANVGSLVRCQDGRYSQGGSSDDDG